MYLSIRRSRGNNNNHIIIERCLIAYLVCMPVHTSPDNAERSFPYNFMDFVNIIEEDFLLIRHFFWGLEPWSQLGCCPLSCLQPTKLRSILHILHILLHVLHSNLVLKSSYWFGFHSCWWTVMRIKFNTNSLWKIKKERTEQGIIFPVGVFFTLWLDPVGSLWFVRRYYAYFYFWNTHRKPGRKSQPGVHCVPHLPERCDTVGVLAVLTALTQTCVAVRPTDFCWDTQISSTHTSS